jgi:hypothetical protein
MPHPVTQNRVINLNWLQNHEFDIIGQLIQSMQMT